MNFVVFSILATLSVTFACRCMRPIDVDIFCRSGFVSRIKIISKDQTLKNDLRNIHYTVEHVETFKSPSKDPLSCDIYTSGSSASCGIDDLQVGQEYLVAGGLDDDDKRLHISSCGQFEGGRLWSDVAAALQKQLKTGFKCPKTTPAP